MELERRHLLPAAGVAAVVHVAVAVAVLWAPPKTGAAGAGVGGIEVSMGAAGGAPGVVSPVAPDAVAEAVSETPAETAVETPTEPAVAEQAPPDTLAEMLAEAVPQAAPEPVTAAEALVAEPVPVPVPVEAAPAPQAVSPPPADTVTAAEPILDPQAAETSQIPEVIAAVEPVQTEVAEADPGGFAAPLPRARPRTLRKPETPRRSARRTEQTRPEPKRAEPQRSQPKRAQPAKAAPKPQPQAPRATPARQSTTETAQRGGDNASQAANTRGQGTSGPSGSANNAGRSQQASLGGDPGALRAYRQRISAILARNQRYPRRAKSRGQEGVGRLSFVVQRNGSITSARLITSTGHRLLDKEIMAILDRIGRLPPIPAEVGRSSIPVAVPIGFNLR
ncbi:MAG: TonB family protein [Pseudomonadota bacterium]